MGWIARTSGLLLVVVACADQNGNASGSSSETSGGSSSDVPPLVCESPTDRLQGPAGDMPSGWVSCADGTIHRPEARACVLPEQTTDMCSVPDSGCSTDADCGIGFCQYGNGGEGEWCQCTAPCTSDADCGAGSVCFCDGRQTGCVAAACTTDADCDGGYLCALGPSGLACHTSADQCRTRSECEDICEACAYDAELQSWQCSVDYGNCSS